MHSVDTALYARLTGDTGAGGVMTKATGVYRHVAPAGAVLPFVIFAKQTEQDDYSQSGKRVRDLTYLVKAVDDPNANNGGAIDERIDSILTDHVLTVSGATNDYLRRVSGVDYVEVVDGIVYRHCGGLYELEVIE